MSPTLVPAAAAPASTRLYRAIWRWHFYAGLVALPFLIVLAVSGLIMLYGSSYETNFGPRPTVATGQPRASLVEQQKAALTAVPGSQPKMLIVPMREDAANTFVVLKDGAQHAVFVDPNGARVIATTAKDDSWYYWANRLHGTLLIGTTGDRIMEIAIGLALVSTLSGLYLWWPRNGRTLGRVLLPNLAMRGRALWKELHVSIGFWMVIVLLGFILSGLSWTGVWGSKVVQPWNTFPTEKYNDVPLSDETHAGMNHGALKEVPWTLEQAKMPASGSLAGAKGLPDGQPVTLDTLAAFGRGLGFSEQFRINTPKGAKGVYTLSADTMDGDMSNPLADRTVHIDQYTGRILADVKFADYPLGGKAMAVGIALHKGQIGPISFMANVGFCLLIIFICVSGAVMWWKRRPVGTLGVPLYPRDYRFPRAILVIAAAVALFVPLTGIGLALFALIDWALPKRWKEAGFQEARA